MWHDNIDKTFLINLSDDVGDERFPFADVQLTKFGLFPYVRYEAIKDVRGSRGLSLTMHRLFLECIHQQCKSALVFEDDIMFIRDDVNEVMEQAMAQLPEDYLTLNLGCQYVDAPVRFSANLTRISKAYATHAVLYSSNAMQLILAKWNPLVLYDIFLTQNIQCLGQSYSVHPMLASQRTGFSSIENRVVDWDSMIQKKNNRFTNNF